jgi:hypothetical protein
MKRTLLAIFLLLVMVSFGKETAGQDTEELSLNYLDYGKSPPVSPTAASGESLYLTHPEFTDIMTTTVTVPAQNTDDGYIFVAPPQLFYGGPSVLMILENTGEPVYIQTIPGNPFVGDFKVQTVDGTDYLTFHSGFLPAGYTFGSSYVLDESYQLVDTWTIDNSSDVHDFVLLDNGHAILLAYDLVPYDFSQWGGPVNGTLVDIILQEQDADKNVVFEWVASEHLPIGDTHANLATTSPVDFLHTNAVEVDNDGNWLLSHRHFSEITKIDRQTGDVIWRLGGAGNEFTFTNDIRFTLQHDIRRLENGNITIFDNGNFHIPAHSRMLEYAIDEVAKTVTRVWTYPGDGSEYSDAMGNFQRLPNGNSFIGWGTQPKVTEVLPDGTVAFEMLLDSRNYRAFRFPWNGTPADPPRGVIQYDADPTAVTIYTSWNGATDITSYDIYAGSNPSALSLVGSGPRTGFETTISVGGLPADTCVFKTKPIHAQGSETPFSNLMFRVDILACWDLLNRSFMPLAAK